MKHPKKNQRGLDAGISKNIHLLQANKAYFNMILTNDERTVFWNEVLQQFLDLLNEFCHGNPIMYKASGQSLSTASYNLNKRGQL
jgi:hypothetical protein